jgi:hypothetical protein
MFTMKGLAKSIQNVTTSLDSARESAARTTAQTKTAKSALDEYVEGVAESAPEVVGYLRMIEKLLEIQQNSTNVWAAGQARTDIENLAQIIEKFDRLNAFDINTFIAHLLGKYDQKTTSGTRPGTTSRPAAPASSTGGVRGLTLPPPPSQTVGPPAGTSTTPAAPPPSNPSTGRYNP